MRPKSKRFRCISRSYLGRTAHSGRSSCKAQATPRANDDQGRRLTMHTPNVTPGRVGKMGNASQRLKLVRIKGMRPVTASQSETTFPEPRENAASRLPVVLGDDQHEHRHRRRGFRQASHSGYTLRATPIRWKRLSPLASIERGATLYPTCDNDAESSSITTHDIGPTMRRSRRTDRGTPRHPRFFTRPPPRSPGHTQRSSPNHFPPIFSI